MERMEEEAEESEYRAYQHFITNSNWDDTEEDFNPVIHPIHNELTVELEENNTDMERSLMIYLRTEMQGDSLKIVQKFNGSF